MGPRPRGGGTIALPHLKIWPEPFEAILEGRKRHEVREEPKDFTLTEGDRLLLREWAPDPEVYTGRFLRVRVGHVTDALPPSPLPKGLVCFGITVLGCHNRTGRLGWGSLRDRAVNVQQELTRSPPDVNEPADLVDHRESILEGAFLAERRRTLEHALEVVEDYPELAWSDQVVQDLRDLAEQAVAEVARSSP